MKIRLYRAFASNNSGSYTLVGRFRDEATAVDVAAALSALCAAHTAWWSAEDQPDRLDGSPLRAFLDANGLVGTPDDVWDHWPQYGPPPQVIQSATKVVVLVPYTVTMPAALGEYVYRRGGRVELELEHSHSPLAVEFTFSVRGARHGEDDASITTVCEQIAAELPALTTPPAPDARAAIPPCWHRDDWARHLSVVFADTGAGILRVRELARAAGIVTHIRIFEVSDRDPDPFARLRGGPRPERGRHAVALWRVPAAARIAIMKVVRDLVGCDLTTARALVDDAPRDVLENVAEQVAEDAAARLRDAGADAEAVLPAPRS